MFNGRKLIMVLALLAITTTVASAARFTCTISAVPTIVRSEAVADFVGDVLINCEGVGGDVLPPGSIANVRLQLLGAKVTSKVVGTANTPALDVLESILLINDPPASALVGYSAVSPSLVPQSDGRQNIYQAVHVSRLPLTEDTIEWQGIVLAGPVTPVSSFTLRLTNVRAYPLVAAGQSIQARVNITSPSAAISFEAANNVVTVADVVRGLFATYTPLSINNCRTGTTDPLTGTITVTFTEGYAMAFKPRYNNQSALGVPHATPGAGYLDESGYNPVWTAAGSAPPSGGSLPVGLLVGLSGTANLIGVATQGTRFRVTITGIPAGVSLSPVSPIPTTNGLTVTATVQSGCTAAGGTCVIDWEVTGYSSSFATAYYQIDQISAVINVTVTNPSPVTTGPVMAHARFWPHSAPVLVAATENTTDRAVPRFLDSPTADDRNVLTITQACRTVLLFPYLVQIGSAWDTGIAISNTSRDPFGTVEQTGPCTIYFYGTNQGTPNTYSTGAIAPGSYWAGILSVIRPGFAGYGIAVCEFQFGHGFAFISDLGAQKLSQGYLALVIPDVENDGSMLGVAPLSGRRAQNAALNAAPNQGEQLGN